MYLYTWSNIALLVSKEVGDITLIKLTTISKNTFNELNSFFLIGHNFFASLKEFKVFDCLASHGKLFQLEFRDSDVSPGKTEVKQGKFVEFISPAKGYFRETYKSKNINPISPTPKFTLKISK